MRWTRFFVSRLMEGHARPVGPLWLPTQGVERHTIGLPGPTFRLRKRPAIIGGRRGLPSSRRRAKGFGEAPPLSNSRGRDSACPWGHGPPRCPHDANALRVIEIRLASPDTATVVTGCGPGDRSRRPRVTATAYLSRSASASAVRSASSKPVTSCSWRYVQAITMAAGTNSNGGARAPPLPDCSKSQPRPF
jgi:hypothetical protein